MSGEKWTYEIDPAGEDGLVHGYKIITPAGQVGTHVDVGNGAASHYEIELRVKREVAVLNGEPAPKEPRPEPVVQGKRR